MWLCLFQYLFGPSKAIFEKRIIKFWKIEKKRFYCFDTKESPFRKKSKKFKFFVFFNKIMFFLLESEVDMFLAFFEVYNICFAQNFKFFIFLPLKFPMITTFILWPLATKMVIKRDYIRYLWTTKDQNNHLRSSFGHFEVFWQL